MFPTNDDRNPAIMQARDAFTDRVLPTCVSLELIIFGRQRISSGAPNHRVV